MRFIALVTTIGKALGLNHAIT